MVSIFPSQDVLSILTIKVLSNYLHMVIACLRNSYLDVKRLRKQRSLVLALATLSEGCCKKSSFIDIITYTHV